MDSYSKFRNIIPCTSPGVAFAVTIYRETYRLTSGQYHGFVGSILGHLYVCYKLASYTTTCKIQTNFDYTNELSTFFLFSGWVLVVAHCPTSLADWFPALNASHR